MHPGTYWYRKALRKVRARLDSVADHPRLYDEIFWTDFGRRHQLRVLNERADSLGAAP